MKVINISIFLIFFCSNSFAQEQWQPLNGPYGGSVVSIAVNSKGKVFIATPGGLFSSTNNGDNWIKADSVDTGIPASYIGKEDIRSIIVDKNDKIYAATDWGIYSSANNGVNWIRIADISVLKLFYSDKYIFGLFSGGNIIRSEDGIHWTTPLGPNALINDLAVNSNGTVFCGGDHRVFRSNDNGDNWTEVLSLTENVVQSVFINKDNNIFIGTFKGIFITSDNGQNWKEISNGLEFLPEFERTINSFASNNSGDLLFAGSYHGIFKSSKNGEKWELINNGLTDKSINVLFYTSDNYLYAGTNGNGFFQSSDDGSTWKLKNTGLTNTSVISLAIDNEGTVYATTISGVFCSKDKGETWNSLISGGWTSICVSPKGYLYALNSNIYRSIDKGATWNQIDSLQFDNMYINPDSEIYADRRPDYDLLYKSINDGTTWEKVATMSWINDIAFNNNSDVFVGTRENLFRSTDKGKNWENIFPGVSSIEINSKGKIFINDDYGTFTSTDNGASWNRLNEIGSDFIFINKLDHIFFNTKFEEGLYLSTNNGKNWKFTGLKGLQINCIAGDGEGYNYTGVEERGIFRLFNNDPVLSVAETPLTTLKFSLSQNYPNPFNPTTKIHYQIPQAGLVTLKLYDMLGKEVSTLVNEENLAGTYEVEFNGSNFASGVYIYKLQAGSSIINKKLLLLK